MLLTICWLVAEQALSRHCTLLPCCSASSSSSWCSVAAIAASLGRDCRVHTIGFCGCLAVKLCSRVTLQTTANFIRPKPLTASCMLAFDINSGSTAVCDASMIVWPSRNIAEIAVSPSRCEVRGLIGQAPIFQERHKTALGAGFETCISLHLRAFAHRRKCKPGRRVSNTCWITLTDTAVTLLSLHT